MSENLDDDLEWLIDENLHSPDDTTENEEASDQLLKSEEEYESDLDDSDGLTQEERELLERNTILNDASDREDYDLKQKLQKANADLERTDASDSSRKVKVMFKQKLIDTEAPPLEYSSDSSSSSSDSDDEKSKKKTTETKILTSENNKQNSVNDEKILVERGGKFKLVNSNEDIDSHKPTSRKLEERNPQISNNHSKHSMSRTSNGKSSFVANPRPASAPTSSQTNRHPRNYQRPTSASRNSEYDHIKSPYAMSPEMKDLMKKRAAAKAEREREEQAQLELKKQEERENAENAWRCWVEKKNNEYMEMKKREQNNKPQQTYDSKKEAEEAYALWVKEKRRQIKRERLLQQQQQLENDEGWYRRDRKECNDAFKQWKNKKRQEAQVARKAEHRLGQRTKSDAFKMRKIQRLLMSIKSTQTTTW